MKLLEWLGSLPRRIVYKRHYVSFAGKKTFLESRRFRKASVPPQEYMDRNAVVCGCCGELILPGQPIWLLAPVTNEEAAKQGVLVVEEGKDRALVGCLSWGCAPTGGAMCGHLEEGRKIAYFESPMAKALRTGEPVIVSDIQNYRG